MFSRAAEWIARQCGHASTFIGAVVIVIVWAASGPLFHFSDTWQLVINTSTTVVTFLMVFLIQNSQNRNTDALHLKLDELIRVNKDASNALLHAEEKDDAELRALRETRP